MADWLPERLPEDIDAERSFLATVCAPGAGPVAAEAVFILTEEDFVHPAHRALFRAVKTCIEKQIEVSSLTLKDALDQDDSLNKVGGYPGLVELLAGEDVERPQVLADVIRRKAKLRRLVHLGAQLVRQAAEEEETPEILVEVAARGLSELVQSNDKGNLVEVQEFSDEWLADFSDRMQGLKEPGLKTGFPRFDGVTQGFKPGNLIVLAARPGIGKTALALNWLLNAARHGKRGAFYTLEMAKGEVFGRLVSAYSQLNLKAIVSGGFDPVILRNVAIAKAEVERLPIHIADRATITVREIRSQTERLIARTGRVEFVIVDYLQLLSSPTDSRGAKQSEAVRISEITRSLKLMAKDLGLPVVVLSQLNREVEHRNNGRPRLSDLRDSGAIEQDADMVAFIHRNMSPVLDGATPDQSAELIIAKQRDGELATISLLYEGAIFRYREIERTTAVAQTLIKTAACAPAGGRTRHSPPPLEL